MNLNFKQNTNAAPSADSVIPITSNLVINIVIFVCRSSATICMHQLDECDWTTTQTDKENKFACT